jgi:outer membrane receptor protein involved in Fe transport
MSEKNINFFPYGRGDLGRTPTFSQIDLLLQQDFRLPGSMRITLGLNAINLFDQKTVTGYQTTPYRDGFNVADATFFGGWDPVALAAAQNFRPDARFGLANTFQDPRVIRLQAKVSF